MRRNRTRTPGEHRDYRATRCRSHFNTSLPGLLAAIFAAAPGVAQCGAAERQASGGTKKRASFTG
jgi:hypothetical protein